MAILTAKTRNFGRGDLPERMQISEKDGEELFKFDGSMMYAIMSEKLSQWILGEDLDELEPEGNLAVLAGNRHGYWVIYPQKTEQGAENLAKIMARKKPHQKPEWQLNLQARQVEIYDLSREDFTQPIAIFHSWLDQSAHGSVFALAHLNANTEEAMGILHVIPALRLAPKPQDRFTQKLLEDAPFRKTTSQGEKKEETPEITVRSGDPELARIFARFENRRV